MFSCKFCEISTCNFIEIETLAQVFSCELGEISKNTFLQNTSWRLLLYKVGGDKVSCFPTASHIFYLSYRQYFLTEHFIIYITAYIYIDVWFGE